MIEHQVWFKFREGIDDARIEQHMVGLRGLKDTVPGVVDLKVGRNFTDRAKGFQLGLSVTLDSREALLGYSDHPNHLAVARPLREDCDEVMALDFEC